MEQNLLQAFELVSKSNNVSIMQGEMILSNLKKNVQYPILLLSFINGKYKYQFQLRSAIELKLWCLYYRNSQQFQRKFYSPVIQAIKTDTVMAYLQSPLQISKTLSEGIIALTQIQFPDNWNNLLIGLLTYCNQNNNNYNRLMPVLHLIKCITYKYSYKTRSDPLYHEIIIVCDTIHDFLLNLTVTLIQSISRNITNQILLELKLLMKIFYNLNYQDLHPKFQDNLSTWMQILNQVMKLHDNNQLVFKCKGAALEAILLYASKYKQDVCQSIRGFSQQIWQLCANASSECDYDNVVLNCLKYFKSLILWQDMKEFFASNMQSLIQKLIIPNLAFNHRTKELFEDQNQCFIDYYFRNTQIGTRRAAALDLLRGICRHYTNFEPYLQAKIMQYQNSGNDIQIKCTLLNLVIDGGSKGFREMDGCTSLYIKPQTIIYCYENIVKISFSQIYEWILKNKTINIEQNYNILYLTTLLRYIFYYRIYIQKQQLKIIIKFICQINTEIKQFQNILYMVLNGILNIRHGDFIYYKNLIHYFHQSNIQDIVYDVFNMVFKFANKQQYLNELLNRAFFLVVKALGSKNANFFQQYELTIAQIMLNKTAQYDFKSASLLFEALGYIAYWLSKTKTTAFPIFQNMIHEYFHTAIKRGSDLLNFCFQILSILLIFQNKSNSKYDSIYKSILEPKNWNEGNKSLMSSYIQYIGSYVLKNPNNLINDKDKIQMVLSRLIQLEHYELFYRFLQQLIKITSLQQFNDSGYLGVSIQGTQIISNISIQAKKQAFIFICELLYNYDTRNIFYYINGIKEGFIQNFLINCSEIIQTMQMRRNKKLMFGGIVKSIMEGCLSIDIQGTLLDLLIDNMNSRFNFKMLDEAIKDTQARDKKEATYKKLNVFDQFESNCTEIDVDEEVLLVKTYIHCLQHNSPSINMIKDKNIERIKRLHEKHIKG